MHQKAISQKNTIYRSYIVVLAAIVVVVGGCVDENLWNDGGFTEETTDDSGPVNSGLDGDIENDNHDAGPHDTGSHDTGPGDTTPDVIVEECVARRCADVEGACGNLDDGCGSTIDCGGCTGGNVCSDNVCRPPAVDCSGIASHSTFELCDSGDDFCAGVFTAGEGCHAFCAAAGLQCSARYGGASGCIQELENVWSCGADNDHDSDWCECERGEVIIPDPTCPVDPADTPFRVEIGFHDAAFVPRSSWVLECRDYAYTALYDEHAACDSEYVPGSARGTATFTFYDVPRGMYDVYVEGRHTINRNPDGALVVVSCGGEEHSEYINQQDEAGVVEDLHGQYCLEGLVEVIMDSTVSSASDSVSAVILDPAS